MISRTDASSTFPPGLSGDGDRDLLAINGRQFDLGAGAVTVGLEPA